MDGASQRRETGWDVAHAGRNFSGLLAGQVATAGFSFATVWLLARSLGTTGYGSVVAIIAATQSIVILTVNWSSVSLFKIGCEEFVETGSIGRSFWARFVLAYLKFALLILAKPLWWPFVQRHFHFPESILLPFFGLLFAVILSTQMQYAYQALKLPRVASLMLAGERFIILAIIATLYFRHGVTVERATFAYIAGPVLVGVAGLLHFWRALLPLTFSTEYFGRLLRFSYPLIGTGLLGYFSTSVLDAWFLVRYLGLAELGVYNIGTQVSGMALQIPTLVGSLLLPYFVTLSAGQGFAGVAKFLRESMIFIRLLWIGASALLAGLGVVLIRLLFGRQFNGVLIPFLILMTAVAIFGPYLMGPTAAANAAEKTGISTIATAIGGAANLVFDYALIPKFGLVGCAVATLLSWIMQAAVWTIWSRKFINQYTAAESIRGGA